jgi:hypothetical protein
MCVIAITAVNAEAQNCSNVHNTEQNASQCCNNTCSGGSAFQTVTDQRSYETYTVTSCLDSNWKSTSNLQATWTSYGNGACGNTPANTRPICVGHFSTPYDLGIQNPGKHMVRVVATNYSWVIVNNVAGCDSGTPQSWDKEVDTQDCISEFCCGGDTLSQCRAAQGDLIESECRCNFGTPVLLDINGDGFQLTSFADGVDFDIAGNGNSRRMSWTARGADDSFLALDRNGNGLIDGGDELFGGYTEQLGRSRPSNGFEALRLLDSNRDNLISSLDSSFSKLRAWTDTNHDGVSEAAELRTLSEVGIESISLDYQRSGRRDQFGNLFKFRARVIGRGAPFAYDVYFLLRAEQRTGSPKPKP